MLPTGSSLVPLATPSPADFTSQLSAIKRGGDGSGSAQAKKKKRSRWGEEDFQERVLLSGMPTVLPSNMSPDEQNKYILQLQIEEANRKLRSGDLGIPARPEDRSPSPEPIYDNHGKRTNTREVRVRRQLEEARHGQIQNLLKIFPDYKPPNDYKPPSTKITDKIFIPQDSHPEVNFIGLIIGPRGNTLKTLEKDTGAKIIIRGKGSVKEGKLGRIPGVPMPGEDEPLHAFITGTTNDSVQRALLKIREIIKQGIEVPDSENDLRKMQLRELALLNGTLREGDLIETCTNCGSTAHKTWQCVEQANVTQNIVCMLCGNAGHIAKDCLKSRPGYVSGLLGEGVGGNANPTKARMDEEYQSFLSELTGEPRKSQPPPPSNSNLNQPQQPQGLAPSWARQPPPPPPNQQWQRPVGPGRMFPGGGPLMNRGPSPSLLGNPRAGWGQQQTGSWGQPRPASGSMSQAHVIAHLAASLANTHQPGGQQLGGHFNNPAALGALLNNPPPPPPP